MTVQADEPQFLSRKDAATYLQKTWFKGISAETLSDYARRGKGPAYSLAEESGRALYTKADLDNWAMRRRPGKVAPTPTGALNAPVRR